MVVNIVDALIVIILIIGILNGIRNGALKTSIKAIGVILVVILAFYLKNPIAYLCFKYLPFLNFKILNGIAVVNILFYEFISYIIAVAILSFVFRIILVITGIIEKVFKATIVLGFISKVIGAVLGLLEAYVIVFVLLFIFKMPFINLGDIDESRYGNRILNNTPILSNYINGTVSVLEKIYDMKDDFSLEDDEYNYNALDRLLEYKVVDVESIKLLKTKNKLSIDNVDTLIEKYGG